MLTLNDAYNLIHEGSLALARAERQGIRVDVEYGEKQKRILTKRINREYRLFEKTKLCNLWKKIYGTKTNLDSDHQLAKLLYTTLKLTPPKTTEKGKQGSTDKESLLQLEKDVPEIKQVLQIRKLLKVRDTYLDAYLREQTDGFIHPFFNLHTVRTYRSSSDRPNFQNIPKRDEEASNICRRALLPRPRNQLLEIDFSGLEVSIAACYHKDPTMLKYLKDPDSDLHRDMAKQIFMVDNFNAKEYSEHSLLRKATKNGFVFPQFYGDYYGNNAVGLCSWVDLPRGKWASGQGIKLPGGTYISDHLISKGVKSFDDFVEHMKQIEDDFWNRRFKTYKRWKKSWIRKYHQRGYIQMLTGFICSEIMGEKEAINYPIQGSAFHCLLWTFIQVDKAAQEENWQTKLIGQIHDSIIFDVHPPELEHVAKTVHKIATEELPKAWPWIIVPLEVDMELTPIDGAWSEQESYYPMEAEGG